MTGLAWAQLCSRAWSLLDSPPPFVVQPSIPVLYFGDRPAYERSPLRVVTVGLNPSLKEFPLKRPFSRFPGGAGLVRDDARGLLRVLDDYFRVDPYRSWFQSYEPVLNGLGASYYEGPASTALHTDLLSPIATDPTWSSLDTAERAALESSGIGLWHDLVGLLRP